MNQWLLYEGILKIEVQILKLIKLRNTGEENKENEDMQALLPKLWGENMS